MNRLLAMSCVLGLILLMPAFAAEDKKGKDDKPNPAVQKMNRDIPRHKEFLKRIENSKGEGEVIFLGDSITHAWESQHAWKEHFRSSNPSTSASAATRPAMFCGVITEGKELENLKPKAAVIMIGTNNSGRDSAPQIAAGIKAIVEELKKQKPDIKILVLGVFPRGNRNHADKETKVVPAAMLHPKIPEINAIIAKLSDGKTVFYKDIGKEFLNKDGGLSADIMPDYLHLSPKGYEIWGKAIKGDIADLVK